MILSCLLPLDTPHLPSTLTPMIQGSSTVSLGCKTHIPYIIYKNIHIHSLTYAHPCTQNSCTHFYKCIHPCTYKQNTNRPLTSCPERMTSTRCHDGSEFNFWLTKYFNCSCSLLMKSVPGVMQLESKRGSDGRIFPFCWALRMRSWASLAERNLLPRCWFILALGATPSTARKSTF